MINATNSFAKHNVLKQNLMEPPVQGGVDSILVDQIISHKKPLIQNQTLKNGF